MKSRGIICCLLLAGLVVGQAPPSDGEASATARRDARQPLFPDATLIDTVRPVPFFRPKVIIREEILIPKDPFLGGALSLVLPGTGQAYCGKWLKGIGFLAGSLLSYTFAARIAEDTLNIKETPRKLGSTLMLFAGLGLHAWSVIDGVNCANAHNRQLMGTP